MNPYSYDGISLHSPVDETSFVPGAITSSSKTSEKVALGSASLSLRALSIKASKVLVKVWFWHSKSRLCLRDFFKARFRTLISSRQRWSSSDSLSPSSEFFTPETGVKLCEVMQPNILSIMMMVVTRLRWCVRIAMKSHNEGTRMLFAWTKGACLSWQLSYHLFIIFNLVILTLKLHIWIHLAHLAVAKDLISPGLH